MMKVKLNDRDQAKSLGIGPIIACPVHEHAVLRAVTGGDVDDATLLEVDEAMECPACRLLLALASGDARFVEHRAEATPMNPRQKVVSFPTPSGAPAGERVVQRPPARIEVVDERLAASSDTLCVGMKASGRYQFQIRPAHPEDGRKATVEVRVGHRTNIGLRWVDGDFRVRLQPGGQELGNSFLNVPAQAGRKVRHVIEEMLEPVG
jgi:hypothetical protein